MGSVACGHRRLQASVPSAGWIKPFLERLSTPCTSTGELLHRPATCFGYIHKNNKHARARVSDMSSVFVFQVRKLTNYLPHLERPKHNTQGTPYKTSMCLGVRGAMRDYARNALGAFLLMSALATVEPPCLIRKLINTNQKCFVESVPMKKYE